MINALTERGISADSFIPVAMASRDPVALKSGSNLPELSRRVTFRVMIDNEQQ